MYNHLKATIKEHARAQHASLVAIRRHLHQYPELSFQETNTAKFIAQSLQGLPVEVQEHVAGTGLVVLIKGKNPEKATVALRADIDALPILEQNDVTYQSKNPGVMHACGHDIHTTSLIGVAQLLSGLRDEFEGTVKLIFQPGEEKNPGGALGMIEEGVLKKPEPVAILGQHVDPSTPVGQVAFVKNTMLASADELHITIKGKGGHAASPHLAIDPILIAAHTIVGLQHIVSRHNNPLNPAVLSLCHIHAGETTNIIPDLAHIKGTFRTTNEVWRAEAHRKMIDFAEHTAKSMGGTCEFHIDKGYPCLVNDNALTERNIAAARSFLGDDQVLVKELRMWAEDFAYYAQQLPGCFYYLGIRNEAKNITSQLHTSTFDADEASLITGPGLMTWLTLQELARHN